VLGDVLREVQSVFLALCILKWLCRSIKDADILYAIDAIIGDIIVFVIVADEIVPSADNRHLIRVYNVLPDLAVRAPPPVFIIILTDLMYAFTYMAYDIL